MRFGSVFAFALLALGETGLCDSQESQSKLFSGSVAGRAAALVRTDVDKPSAQKRQISFENGGINLGGLQLGGKNKGNGAGQASETAGNVAGNRTANNNAGLTIGGVQLGGKKPAGGTGNSVLDAFLGAANGAKKNGNATATAEQGLGSNPGEAAKAKEAAKEAQRQGNRTEAVNPARGTQQAETGQATEGQPKAVAESEQFKDNLGIIVGANGQVQNVGGDLGITKGSDGSTSVGGKDGINISARGNSEQGQNNEIEQE
ncbi:uncharacterized protein ColSpa_06298 [Colletotrichum spaethianum]|uniref:Uncharacterized protein n=1 Tax=Colletotrichum spaethianum TaxID=700344 RepID=A0AA37NYD2_9PEZI|nr:uncharacterized protein ColSpa_06298 [Colletotrichum spaethianum]GKT46117.1 hypothetical protein ColSpa_06298 [Colletotrichum spaethianum]